MKIRNKKGFTLVEMIISLAIISIMMMGMLAFFGPVTSTIKDMSKKTDAETAVVNITSYITKSITQAKKVVVCQGMKFSDVQSKMNNDEIGNKFLSSALPFDPAVDEIKCLRLSWVPRVGTSKGYMLVDEPMKQVVGTGFGFVDAADYSINGIPDTMSGKKVYNDGYYKNFNFIMKFSIEKAIEKSIDPTTGKETTAEKEVPYLCSVSSEVYTDATYKDILFSSENSKDYILFNNMKLNYNDGFTIEFMNGTSTGHEDIYIFYRVAK